MTDLVLSERRGPVALLTLNRPDALNALNRGLLETLADRTAEIAADSSVRAVVVTGAGRAFAAGADIAAMREMTAIEGEAFSRLGHRVLASLEELSVPTIAAVNGFALGGGCELACAWPVQGVPGCRHAVGGEVFEAPCFEARRPRACPVHVNKRGLDGVGGRSRVVWRKARGGIEHEVAHAADVAGDDRDAEKSCLEEHVREPLDAGGQRQEVEAGRDAAPSILRMPVMSSHTCRGGGGGGGGRSGGGGWVISLHEQQACPPSAAGCPAQRRAARAWKEQADAPRARPRARARAALPSR